MSGFDLFSLIQPIPTTPTTLPTTPTTLPTTPTTIPTPLSLHEQILCQHWDTIYVTPEHLIREYLTRFSIPQEREDDIISVFRQVDGKSSLLNRSRPQSVAAGVIWYWIRKEHKGVPLKDFTQKMDLSELTINKISKEITKIINLKPKTEK
jgi:transcription initiation factor TFIIIB Brf1 subunit/transcription initiation factor TFIIB